MADRYWVGGSGTWDNTNTTNWSTSSGGAGGASRPYDFDDVYFDSNSGSTYTVTLGAAALCKTIRITKPSGTVSIVSGQLSVYGSLLIFSSTGVTFNPNVLNIPSTTPVNVDINGATLSTTTDLQFGRVTLLSDFNAPNADLKMYDSTNIGTYTLTCSKFSIVSSSKTLTFGSNSKIVVLGSGDLAFFNSPVVNTTAVIASGASIEMASTSAKTFNGGGRTWPSLVNTGTGTLKITGSNTFSGDLEVRAIPSTLTLTAGTTQTVTGSVILNGTTTNRITLNSSSPGSRATLSKASGTVIATGLDIRDSSATGGATWVAIDSIDTSNNSGWVFGIVTGGNMFQLF